MNLKNSIFIVIFPLLYVAIFTKCQLTSDAHQLYMDLVLDFEKLDVNDDKVLDLSEWSRNPRTGTLGKTRFQQFDTESNGRIDLREFMLEQGQQKQLEMAAKKFEQLELESDAFGTLNAKTLENVYEIDGTKMTEFMKIYDQNGDGLLNLLEFTDFYRNELAHALQQAGQQMAANLSPSEAEQFKAEL